MGSKLAPEEELVDALILVVVEVVGVGVDEGVDMDENTPPALLLVSWVEATLDAGRSSASYVFLDDAIDAFDAFDEVEKGEATELVLVVLETPQPKAGDNPGLTAPDPDRILPTRGGASCDCGREEEGEDALVWVLKALLLLLE